MVLNMGDKSSRQTNGKITVITLIGIVTSKHLAKLITKINSRDYLSRLAQWQWQHE